MEYKEKALIGAVEHIKEYLVGKNPLEIEKHWHNIYRDAYWRGGPVLMSALSAVEMALWDIIGKSLNVPVYQLLGGNIVFINSNTAYRAIPDRIAYSASKSGQLGLMRAMALDFGKYNIRVNAVLPGMIKTDRWEKNPEFYKNIPSRFTPLGDVAIGSDIADAVWYFAAHAKNTTGAELVVDGGNTIQLYPIIK